MGSDLKPCPFCGVSNTHTANGWLDGRHNEEEWWQVECQECCAAGPSKPFEYQAAEAWNNAGAATARAEAAEQRAEALAAEVAQARAEGAAAERTAIIAWLRRNPGIPRGPECITAMTPLECADAIAVLRHLSVV